MGLGLAFLNNVTQGQPVGQAALGALDATQAGHMYNSLKDYMKAFYPNDQQPAPNGQASLELQPPQFALNPAQPADISLIPNLPRGGIKALI